MLLEFKMIFCKKLADRQIKYEFEYIFNLCPVEINSWTGYKIAEFRIKNW